MSPSHRTSSIALFLAALLAACGAERPPLEPPVPPRALPELRWGISQAPTAASTLTGLARAVEAQTNGDDGAASSAFEEAAGPSGAPGWLLLRAADAAKRAGDLPRAVALAKSSLAAFARATGSKRTATPQLELGPERDADAGAAVVWLDGACIGDLRRGELTLRSARDGAPLVGIDVGMRSAMEMFPDAAGGLVLCSGEGECRGLALATLERQFGERQPPSLTPWSVVRGRPLSATFLVEERAGWAIHDFAQGRLVAARDAFFDALALADLAAVSADGEWLVETEGLQIRVHHSAPDAEPFSERPPPLVLHVDSEPTAVETGAKGGVAVTATRAGSIELFELPTGAPRWSRRLEGDDAVRAMWLGPGDAELAVLRENAFGTRALTVLDAESGEPVLGPIEGVADIAFASRGADLAVLSTDGELLVSRASGGPRALAKLTPPTGESALVCTVGRFRLPRWVCDAERRTLSHRAGERRGARSTADPSPIDPPSPAAARAPKPAPDVSACRRSPPSLEAVSRSPADRRLRAVQPCNPRTTPPRERLADAPRTSSWLACPASPPSCARPTRCPEARRACARPPRSWTRTRA
ncbi:MAG: hypothetical protein U0414_12980 [Polyangiaceae bacterium]